MKIIGNIFLAIVIFSGSVGLSVAQDCASYGVTLNVIDNDVKPVSGATFRIVPWFKNELGTKNFTAAADTPGAYKLTLSGEDTVTANYKIYVNAPGFLETEKTVAFPVCANLTHDILLLRKKEKIRMVAGRIGDDQGNAMAYATVTFATEGQPDRTINADYMGYYEIRLVPGAKYTMTVKKSSYPTFVNDNLMVPKEGRLTFHVIIRSKYK